MGEGVSGPDKVEPERRELGKPGYARATVPVLTSDVRGANSISSEKNIYVALLVCAYCNSSMIAFELLAKHAGSPADSNYKFPAL